MKTAPPLSSIRELKHRFEQVATGHLKRWEEAHEEPQKPSARVVLTEILSGAVTRVDENELKDALDHGNCAFLELLSTPSLDDWEKDKATFKAEWRAFQSKIDDQKQQFLDRIMFDHESAFLLLEDFKKWSHDGKVD